jgi:hypothetical protein
VIIAIAQGIVATARFADLALGLAAPAFATNQLSGHYIETETGAAGQSTTNDWYVTPCSDRCASINSNGGPLAQARLANGQWTMDTTAIAACPDGTRVPNAFSDHYTWDPNTLAGTVRITNTAGVCGKPAGDSGTINMQLRQAP